jgi:hypothetical protein
MQGDLHHLIPKFCSLLHVHVYKEIEYTSVLMFSFYYIQKCLVTSLHFTFNKQLVKKIYLDCRSTTKKN